MCFYCRDIQQLTLPLQRQSDLPILSPWRRWVPLLPRQLKSLLPGGRPGRVTLLGGTLVLLPAVAHHLDSSKDNWLFQLTAIWKGLTPYMGMGGRGAWVRVLPPYMWHCTQNSKQQQQHIQSRLLSTHNGNNKYTHANICMHTIVNNNNHKTNNMLTHTSHVHLRVIFHKVLQGEELHHCCLISALLSGCLKIQRTVPTAHYGVHLGLIAPTDN